MIAGAGAAGSCWTSLSPSVGDLRDSPYGLSAEAGLGFLVAWHRQDSHAAYM